MKAVLVRTQGMTRARELAKSYELRVRPVYETTPLALFRALDNEFHFTLDAAASDTNHLCERYFTEREDGRLQDWGGEVVWLNPPYGRTLGSWMAKARDAAGGGATVVCLVPSATSVAWWHDIVMHHASEIRFLRKRLRYGVDRAEARPFSIRRSSYLGPAPNSRWSWR